MLFKEFDLHSIYKPAGDQAQAIDKLQSGLKAGLAYQTLLGVTGSGKTFTIANVIANENRPTIILAPNKTLAAQLYGEMKVFFPNNSVEYFVSYYDYYQPEAYVPTTDTFIEKDASVNDHIEQMRLSATKALLERKDVIIVASVSAIYGLGDPNTYLKMMLHLRNGELIQPRKIIKYLAQLQYVRNDIAFARGNFRVRGDVIDIYPAESEFQALRVEFFDDEIESLSIFDPLTGKIIQKVERYTIYPKTHYVTPQEQLISAIKKIKKELYSHQEFLHKNNKLVEEQRITQRTLFDIEMIKEIGYCSGIENYSRYLSNRNPGDPPPTLLDYLPDDGLLIIDESHVTISQVGAMYKGDYSRKKNLVDYGFRLPSALDNRPLKFDEFIKIAPQMIFVSATPGKFEEQVCDGEFVEQVIRPTGLLDPEIEVRPVGTQIDDLLSEINKRNIIDERVLVTTLTKKMAEDLTEYLEEHNIKVRYLHSDIDTIERVEIIRDLRLGVFDVLVGINLLREGLDMPEVSLVAILDADKEGFLRSERSLIQTIGRVARNIKGKAILYGDVITKSMQKAIDETRRRRVRQKTYNLENNIEPKGLEKSVTDILKLAGGTSLEKRAVNKKSKKIDNTNKYIGLSSKAMTEKIKRLEEEMYKKAQNLEFEEAASIRDEVSKLKELFIENS